MRLVDTPLPVSDPDRLVCTLPSSALPHGPCIQSRFCTTIYMNQSHPLLLSTSTDKRAVVDMIYGSSYLLHLHFIHFATIIMSRNILLVYFLSAHIVVYRME